MAGIFLNYRRSDSEAWAGRLYESLQERLPGITIFRDIDNVPVGVKFSDHIAKAVDGCDVFITLIGPSWLDSADEKGNRRLDDPHDFVRTELGAALRMGKPIVPTLVGGAAMPLRETLPADLQGLADWQNHEIPSRLWNESCDRLASSLKQFFTTPHPAPPPAPQPPVRPQWRRWAVIAASVVVLAAGGAALYNRLRHGPEARGIRVVATPSKEPSPVNPAPPIVPTFQLEGLWTLDVPPGQRGNPPDFTVKQYRSVVQILVNGRDQAGMTVNLRPEQDLVEAILTEKKVRIGKVTIHITRPSLEWKASFTTRERPDGSEVEAGIGQGSVSSDWRHWKGTFTLTKENEVFPLSLDINNADSEVIWISGPPANQRLTLRKK